MIKDLLARLPALKVVDLSADFRLADPAAYVHWYGHPHAAPELQKNAVYGSDRDLPQTGQDGAARCQPRLLYKLRRTGADPAPARQTSIDPDEIVIDAKSGVTGAGRGAREDMQFAEVSEGFHAYGVGHHRHMAELDQEFSLAAGRKVVTRPSRRISRR